MRQMVKSADFSEGFIIFHTKKRIKKSGVFSKGSGVGMRIIFRPLGILSKIIDETNGEKCILSEVFIVL